MSNLSQRITALIEGPMQGQGWCTPAKAHDLALAVLKTKSSVTVEIGVFYGRSLIPMAMAHKEQGHGVCWAIDPWNASEAIKGQNEVNADWWANKVDLNMVHDTFVAHLKVQGLEDYVRVMRRASDEVIPPHEIGVLHVDGNHSDQAIRDVERFAPNVVMNGFCFMDDLKWHPGIETAVDRLKKMGFVHRFDRDTGAMFERVPMNRKYMKKAPAKKRSKK